MKLTLFISLLVCSVISTLSQSKYSAPSLWGWNFNTSNAIYDPGIPHYRNSKTVVYSSCGNNGKAYGPDTGYACPHLMMYSTDMLLAARYDNLSDDFLYGVCGSSTEMDCGKCYQVQPLMPESSSTSVSKQLILQIVNSGFDVAPGHFDIYMGAGGFGFYTACNSDCKTNYCMGGACVEGMYDSDFKAWNPFSSNCYGGGVRIVDAKKEEEIVTKCHALSGHSAGFKDQVLWQSCIETNLKLYHQNFISANSVPVQCPEGLVRLTGLRRQNEDHLPLPHVENQFSIFCNGSQPDHNYCLTSMDDCCMPSCAWMNKGNVDKKWSKVDSCRKDGTIWNYE